jgi:hypothetical protein
MDKIHRLVPAQGTTGADVKHPLRIVALNASIGRIPALPSGARERQESTYTGP